ncbi:MAG: tripartite tricarboxylate transporter substrate binding protein, partial [Polaromonas sp.]
MNRRHFALSLSSLSIAGWLPLAHAQAWPDKPVRFVLSQPAGSGPDNVARLLSDRLAKGWAQPVVIDNKPGGQNITGALVA